MDQIKDALLTEKARITRDVDDALRLAEGLRVVRQTVDGLCIVTVPGDYDSGTVENEAGQIIDHWSIVYPGRSPHFAANALDAQTRRLIAADIEVLQDTVGKLMTQAKYRAEFRRRRAA